MVAFKVKSLIARETLSGKHLQEFVTSSGNEGSLNHIVSRQKGREGGRIVDAVVLMSKGQ